MIDKTSPIPIYVQIEEALKNKIFLGEYKQGEAIPSERDLCEQFDVSRMTVRQAITNLVISGLLYREKGRGTFVASPKLDQSLNALTSFTEDMLARGMKPSNKLISFERVVPSIDIAKQLKLDAKEEVYAMVRVRNADHLPMALERTYIPVKTLPELDIQKIKGSLYEAVEKKFGLKISYAMQEMEATLATTEDRKYLQLSEQAVVIIFQRMSYLADGRPFELVRSAYRADRYKFHYRIQR